LEREDPGLKKKRSLLQGPLMYLLLLAVIFGVVTMMGGDTPVQSVNLNYSEFLEWVEADLRAEEGEILPDEQKEMSISRISIQSNVLYGLKENSLVADASFPTSYDFKVVLPSETQFYSDVNLIYEDVLGHSQLQFLCPSRYAQDRCACFE
jgi:hypothetical protein